MNKREYKRLVRRAAVAYQLDDPDYGNILDEATATIDHADLEPDGFTFYDTAWEQFCRDLDAECLIPPTETEQKAYARKKRKREIEEAEREIWATARAHAEAKQRYAELKKR